MLNRLKQKWQQSPVLITTLIVLLLLLIGGVILASYAILTTSTNRNFSDSRYGLYREGPRPNPVVSEAFKTASFAPDAASGEKSGLKIIKTATLRFQVKDFQTSRSAIDDLIKRYGGYITSENQHNASDRIESAIVIRVPAANLDQLLDSLQGQAAYLDYKNIEASDVTVEFVDTEARLKAKREVEQRYLAVLKQAASVKDILEVESHLGKIREEIEATEGRLRYLKDQVEYSTVNLTIYQPIHRLPRTESGFWSKLGKSLVNGWNGLLNFIIGITALWPLPVIVGAGLAGYRFWRKKRAE
ncbi:MAG: DUF4349 domain-containing protein [Firmicutes bacterium]|nr:DUF4349 domain-containing protein [Bacillota bacterium]